MNAYIESPARKPIPQMSSGETDAAGYDKVARARRTAEARYGFRWNLAFYIVVNALLIGIWYFVSHGFFWPVFVLGGWGIGVVANYWVAYRGSDKTWVDKETDRILAEQGGKSQ